MWKKTLDATPITDTQNLWHQARKADAWLSITGVYLPCLNVGNRSTLIELERVISESAHMGPVIIAGDFNAHLGSMWGPRAHRSPNVQGILLGELLDRENLHAVSLSEFATGPSHTYCSGVFFRLLITSWLILKHHPVSNAVELMMMMI